MSFEQYLAEGRNYRLNVTQKINPPYADELLRELKKHLATVERWIDGKINRLEMADAMDFFGTRYAATSKKVYRGTQKLIFDGLPASYTKKEYIAKGFATYEADKGWFGRKPFYVIGRKPPAKSLDLAKLLKDYATGKIYEHEEAEVILFNTPVGNKSITEYEV